MVFLETPVFTRTIVRLLSDEEYRLRQALLIEDPARGKLIPGSRGLRKLRWSRAGMGKRGGLRTIYYWAVAADRILMVYAYPKSTKEDLTARQLSELSKLAHEEFGNG